MKHSLTITIAGLIAALCGSASAEDVRPTIPPSLHKSREVSLAPATGAPDPCGATPVQPIGKRIAAVSLVIITRADVNDHLVEQGKSDGLLFDDQSSVVIFNKARAELVRDKSGTAIMSNSPTRAPVMETTCSGLIVRAAFVRQDDGDHIVYTLDLLTDASELPEAEARKRADNPGLAAPLRRISGNIQFEDDEAIEAFRFRNDDNTVTYVSFLVDKSKNARLPR